MKTILAAVLFAVFICQPCQARNDSKLEGTEWWLLSGIISQGFYQGQVYICVEDGCESMPEATYDDKSFTTDDGTYSGVLLFGNKGYIRIVTENDGVFFKLIRKKSNHFGPPPLAE